MVKVIRAATVVVYGTTEIGKRRGAVVFNGNNEVKHGWLKVNGQEYQCSRFNYQIRTYELGAAVYTTVGTNYRDAETMLVRMQAQQSNAALKERLQVDLPTPNKSLRIYLTEFQAKKSKLSVDSIALYDTLNAFITYAAVDYPEELKSEHIAGYYDALLDQGYAQRTAQTRYVAVRGFLKHCGLSPKDVIDDDDNCRLRKKPDPKTEPYTQAQIDKLMAVADDYYKVVFQLLLATGLRYREASHLTWSQIKWDENYIDVRGVREIHHPKLKKVIKFKTKNRKSRRVPLFPSLKATLKEWRAKNPDTTFVVGTRRDLPDNHWLEYLKDYGREAGINCGVCEGCAGKGECAEVYLHKFRHGFAHTTLKKFTIHQVSKWMGHSSIAVTAIYLTGTPDDPTIDPFDSPKKPMAERGKVLEFAAS